MYYTTILTHLEVSHFATSTHWARNTKAQFFRVYTVMADWGTLAVSACQAFMLPVIFDSIQSIYYNFNIYIISVCFDV